MVKSKNEDKFLVQSLSVPEHLGRHTLFPMASLNICGKLVNERNFPFI